MTKSTKTFVVKDNNDNLIAGFNRSHQIVQWAGDVDNAKKWKTFKGADKWADNHADAGYGFSSDYKVVEI
jgi:hypothetical protein